MNLWSEMRAVMMQHPWIYSALFAAGMLNGLYLHMFIPWAG